MPKKYFLILLKAIQAKANKRVSFQCRPYSQQELQFITMVVALEDQDIISIDFRFQISKSQYLDTSL